MDTFQLLVQTNFNLCQLGKEVNIERNNLVQEYQNKTSVDSEWYITKVKYTAFAEELKRETEKFAKLLDELDEVVSVGNNNNNVEIVDHLQSESESFSPATPEKVYDTLSTNLVTVNDNLYMNEVPVINTVKVEEERKEERVVAVETAELPVIDTIKAEEERKEEFVQAETAKTVEAAEEAQTAETAQTAEPTQTVEIAESVHAVEESTKQEKVITLLSNSTWGKAKQSKRSKVKQTKRRPVAVVHKYQYGGQGFNVFTNGRNRNTPIYSSTMLYCRDACNKNKAELKKYLVKYGQFKKGSIEDIIFKSGWNGDYYALIKVKSSLQSINNKIQKFNDSVDYECLSIFERTTIVNSSVYEKASRKLYITNFDILNANSHRRFTNLMLRFGDLAQDVQMGLDRNKDLYAI